MTELRYVTRLVVAELNLRKLCSAGLSLCLKKLDKWLRTINSNILEKLFKIGMGLYFLTLVLSPFLNTGTTAVCFHKDGKVALVTLRLNICVNSGISTSKQPLIVKDGIPSSTTHLGLRRLIALITSAAEIRAVGKKSEALRSEGIMD
jgi:hypothetical protein